MCEHLPRSHSLAYAARRIGNQGRRRILADPDRVNVITQGVGPARFALGDERYRTGDITL